ncbi:MAG: methyltransferase domain-containing protein [Desulfuromonadaceae bacterium]|nr:methyltransferase domain-containing protein [Desulfuromonadaceae bacterium]
MSKNLYGQTFYDSQILGSLQSAQVYLYYLFSIWGVPGSVADLGCGRGAWLATCRDLGVRRVVGLDGDWNSQRDMLDQHIQFYPADLEQKIPLTDTFDLAMSLEVAEHLHPDSSATFVESLCGLSDAVLFGAAFTGQPGQNHINTRPHSFWAEFFFSRGYVLFDLFRPVFWDDDRVDPCYRQNTFLYVKPEHSLFRALEQKGHVCKRDTQFIDCVHPAVYVGLVREFNKLQRSLVNDKVESSPDTTDLLPGAEDLYKQAENQIALRQTDAAADTYRQILAGEPDNPECLLRLSALLLHMKCYEECFQQVQHFLRLVDDVAFAYVLAGQVAREVGHWQESREFLLRAIVLDPSNVYARVLCCMSIFTICGHESEAEAIIHAYADELDRLVCDTLLNSPGEIMAADEAIGVLTPFFLPYLGCDVKDLQRRYGSWVCSIMAAKYPQFTQPLTVEAAPGKIKIGIVSNYFHHHSNWKIPISGWLEQLDRRQFSIHCFYTGDINDAATESARSLADSFFQDANVESLAVELYGHKCDVLLYPGIGMDTATLKLAALRLAPVQCASWGHPVTTGMPTIDYYISSALMEPAEADSHYTEKLIRLPNLSVWCEPVTTNQVVSGGIEIPGLKEQDIVFLCNQNILKYLPHYDGIFPAIARQVENARFVFIASYVPELTEKFLRRLDNAFDIKGLTAADYVTVLPQLGEAGFIALNARADVFLDSIEWSGCNTVLESLPFNTPIVTLPGSFMRGRHAYAVLKMMGIKNTIASNVDDYISIAVCLANDLSWRKEISARICQNKHRIYRDRECIDGLERFLLNVSGREKV